MDTMTEIETPIGTLQRLSYGEVTVPTYYGLLTPDARRDLRRTGRYKEEDLHKATGIRRNGDLVIFTANGYYYEMPAISKVVGDFA